MLKVGIIDDEKDALESLELILNEFFNDILVVGKAQNFEDAISLITGNDLDVIFLDIEMPEADGFDIIKHINTEKTFVVFVTAYNQYALRAFRANAIDYVLKPIDISVLKSSVERIKTRIQNNEFPDISELANKLYKSPKISISSMEGIEYINLEDIILIEADKSYSIFHLSDRTIISSKNLKYYSDKIKDDAFYRPHNSYLVNLNHVVRYEYKDGAKIELSNGQKIPISRSKRNEFLETIEKYFENI